MYFHKVQAVGGAPLKSTERKVEPKLPIAVLGDGHGTETTLFERWDQEPPDALDQPPPLNVGHSACVLLFQFPFGRSSAGARRMRPLTRGSGGAKGTAPDVSPNTLKEWIAPAFDSVKPGGAKSRICQSLGLS